MKHLTLYIYLLLFSLSACAQTQKASLAYAATVPLGKTYTLVFLNKEANSSLYKQPRLKSRAGLKAITGFEEQNCASKKVKLSPDGRYATMDHITRGYVMESERDSVFHENYSCVIVDLKQAKVVQYLQSECDGAWNKKSEWVSNDQVVFSKEEK